MLLTLALLAAPFYAADWPAEPARCRPVPLVSVKPGGFLGRHIEANRRSLLEGLKSPIPRRFEARAAGREPGPETNRLASDSDLYKWMEGAAYMVALTRDPTLERELERIAALVIQCQQPDGYINTQVPPNIRFDPKVNHELYTAGHFFEAAVAHYRATGKRELLDAARRWAAYLMAEYQRGNPYFQTVGKREHSEYELGFLRLARATGERGYRDFSMTLARMIPVTPDLLPNRHAVRAGYLLSGYADLYLETGSEEWRRNLDGIWREIVTARSYVSGGVSARERYQQNLYDLPQVMEQNRSSDIAETCTSIALMMFAWRMHAIEPRSEYFDRIETILYNHFLGALDLDHLGTFYYNPLRLPRDLKGKTDHGGPLGHRTRLPAVHSTACCISNEWRFLSALPEYLFSQDERGLYVNLYTSAALKDRLTVETDYPHRGRVLLRIQRPGRFLLRLRIPPWCRAATVAVNRGKREPAKPGYAALDRAWKRGDTVTLDLPMPVRMILPDARETANAGQAVLARGPLVYCLEQRDQPLPLERARMNFAPAQVRVRWRPELLGGVNVLEAPGGLRFIPFYARANRGENNRWTTWLPRP